MAADKSDEQGVLGNLPRSRPGHRSDKRGGGAEGADRPAQPKTFSEPRAAAPKKAAASSRAPKRATATAAAKPRSAPRRKAPTASSEPETAPASTAPPPDRKSDPLTDAVRLAGKVAEVGLKTAGQILRRLPGR